MTGNINTPVAIAMGIGRPVILIYDNDTSLWNIHQGA
jgi:hypothetical protein